jgi:hypothetical protein
MAVNEPTKAGIYLFGLGTAAAGVFDFVWGEFESAHQPIQAFGDHIPGVKVLTYITAFWLVASGLALLWRRTAKPAALAVTAIYLVFAIFWIPRLITAPRMLGYRAPIYIGVLAGLGTQFIAVVAGILLYASIPRRTSSWPTVSHAARWVFGLCSIDFGVTHLTQVADVATLVPAWMPLGGRFWTIFTGIAFTLAGLSILAGVLDVMAARLLALMLLVFSTLALVPLIIASPHDHVAWGANAYNLAAVASVWIFADSISAPPA